MAGTPAEQSSPQWFVYTRLGPVWIRRAELVQRKRLATRQEAQAFLDGPSHDWPESRAWCGPVKLEPLSYYGYFTGPWLADALKDADFDSEWTWDRIFNADFAACGADVALVQIQGEA
jgi:hypothetical protein